MGSSEDDPTAPKTDEPARTDETASAGQRWRGSWRLWLGWLSFLAKPARHTALIFIVLLVVEYLVVPELVGASKNLYLLGRVNIGWVVAGTVLEGVSLFCYAVLTKVLLPPGPKPGLSRLFRIDLSAAAVAHVIPAGTLGTAALGFRLFTAEGISGNNATVMMAAKGIGSTVVLNVLLWLSLVVSIPLAGFQPIYGTVAVIGTIVLLAVGLLVYGVMRGAKFASRMMRTLGDKIPFLSGEKLERAVLDAAHSFSLLARDRRVMAWALLWASLNWLLDAASLWCWVAAFGHLTNPVELFAAYGIANVAGALPITPGGLGVVDSIAPLLLVGFGVTRSVATLGVLGWRVINFWLPIPAGALSFVSLKMKPHSGLSALRSAFPRLLAASEAAGEPADSAEEHRLRSACRVDGHAADRRAVHAYPGEDARALRGPGVLDENGADFRLAHIVLESPDPGLVRKGEQFHLGREGVLRRQRRVDEPARDPERSGSRSWRRPGTGTVVQPGRPVAVHQSGADQAGAGRRPGNHCRKGHRQRAGRHRTARRHEGRRRGLLGQRPEPPAGEDGHRLRKGRHQHQLVPQDQVPHGAGQHPADPGGLSGTPAHRSPRAAKGVRRHDPLGRVGSLRGQRPRAAVRKGGR